MHELSVCQSIADIALRHAAGRTVQIVRVRIGELRQIVPDTLVYCWALVNEQTPLAETELEVERVRAAIRCRHCAHVTTLHELDLSCGSCAGHDVEVVAGEEFLITSLELVET